MVGFGSLGTKLMAVTAFVPRITRDNRFVFFPTRSEEKKNGTSETTSALQRDNAWATTRARPNGNLRSNGEELDQRRSTAPAGIPKAGKNNLFLGDLFVDDRAAGQPGEAEGSKTGEEPRSTLPLGATKSLHVCAHVSLVRSFHNTPRKERTPP